MSTYRPTYHDLTVSPPGLGEINIHYISAGDSSRPTIILLPGFPSDTRQYRDFIPLLSDHYHVLSPDLPGFGLSTAPKTQPISFDVLAAAIDAWISHLALSRYAIYIFDYGAPVGLRIALAHPHHIAAIISQNGNAYDEGFGHPFWDPIEQLWATDNSPSVRATIAKAIFTLPTTKFQYVAGVPEEDLPLIDPVQYTGDHAFNLSTPEQHTLQLDLFYDYRKNKELYPTFQQYFRDSQVPLLAVWGNGDPAFIPAGAEAFKRDLPKAEITLLDAGHFALETQRWEIARLTLEFLGKVQW